MQPPNPYYHPDQEQVDEHFDEPIHSMVPSQPPPVSGVPNQ